MDLKSKLTLPLFLAVFCTEGVGCYNRKVIQSVLVRDTWWMPKPVIVLRDSSINAPANEWGPLHSYEDELESFLMWRDVKDDIHSIIQRMAEDGKRDLDPATLEEIEKISAAWLKSWSQLKGKTQNSHSLFITIDDRGHPIMSKLSQEVGRYHNERFLLRLLIQTSTS